MLTLHSQYGKIAKVGGLIGHPDLLFIYDGDEIRKVFAREEIQPHRWVVRPCPKPYAHTNWLVYVWQTIHAVSAPLQDHPAEGLFRRKCRRHWGVSRDPVYWIEILIKRLFAIPDTGYSGTSSGRRCNKWCCSGRLARNTWDRWTRSLPTSWSEYTKCGTKTTSCHVTSWANSTNGRWNVRLIGQ